MAYNEFPQETGWRPTWGSVAWSESIRGWRVRVYMWLEFEWLAGVMEACLFYLFYFFYLFYLFEPSNATKTKKIQWKTMNSNEMSKGFKEIQMNSEDI